MKVRILLLLTSLFLLGCPGQSHSSGDGHAHSATPHGPDDGHRHAEEEKTATPHGPDDGHGHAKEEKTAAHKSDDGHGH